MILSFVETKSPHLLYTRLTTKYLGTPAEWPLHGKPSCTCGLMQANVTDNLGHLIIRFVLPPAASHMAFTELPEGLYGIVRRRLMK